MTHRNKSDLVLIILFCCCNTFLFNNSLKAQSEPKEKPKIKNFGSSLKSNKENNDEKSPNNLDTIRKSGDDADDVIKIETRLVRTDVLVVDQKGKAVIGLKADDFIITENNVQQEIGTFSLGENVDVPKSIVLIMDYSGSQVPFIENSVEAAKVLVDKLNPKDRMAIVNDDVEILTGFTNDKELLKKKLNASKKYRDKAYDKDWSAVFGSPLGKSLQFSALMATLGEMFDAEDIRPIIIFQSDGDEAFNIARPESEKAKEARKILAWDSTSFTIADLFNRIEKSRATIYSVIPGFSIVKLSAAERTTMTTKLYTGPNSEHSRFYFEKLFKQHTAMMIVARASGGFTEILEKPQQADEIYSKILNDINNRYLLGFYPKNEERDGKRRTVKIEVRGHPEYVVTGRKTYLAPEPEK